MILPMPASVASCQTRRVLTFHSGSRFDDDDGRVDGPHGANRLTNQVGVAGAVDHVEVLARVSKCVTAHSIEYL